MCRYGLISTHYQGCLQYSDGGYCCPDLTGGYRFKSKVTRTQVTVYNSAGWMEDWPELNTGRRDHACGHFVNTDNQVVRQQHYTHNIHPC